MYQICAIPRHHHTLLGCPLGRVTGQVRYDGTIPARVSYNGRLWTPDGLLLQD